MSERRWARSAILILIGLVCLSTNGCAPSAIPSPTPERATVEPTQLPTLTATPIPTATSVPTATLTPTPKRATATSLPMSTGTPVPTGAPVLTATPTLTPKRAIATSLPTSTATPIPTRTPVPTVTPTPIPTATPTTTPSPTPTPEPTPTEVAEKLAITILYDNNQYDERLETDWGFSCLVEGLEKTILFDTGGDSAMLLRNMRKLGIDPQIVEAIVISHIHYDHLGGLAGFLEENNDVTVYLPECLPESIKDTVRVSGAELVEVREPTKVCERAYSTGELGDLIKEQALVIETDEGLVVITGCAHPGIVNVVREAKKQLKSDVHLVVGGFHLCWMNILQVRGIVDGVSKEGVEMVAPCHCSGDLARSTFEKAYGENFILVGVGRRLEIGGE
jgi:7,8-dihydropterin-6-yl-methyl-4-(beta-D-ribofuranosyl)aminobenzene 5'-phosphate synthase